MDKYGSVDQNWYSSENQKHERENAEQVLSKNRNKMDKEKLNKILPYCGHRLKARLHMQSDFDFSEKCRMFAMQD